MKMGKGQDSKKAIKKAPAKTKKEKKQKRDLKKRIDNYASSRPCILSNLFMFCISIKRNETPLAQPPPKGIGFKQEPRSSGVFCLWI